LFTFTHTYGPKCHILYCYYPFSDFSTIIRSRILTLHLVTQSELIFGRIIWTIEFRKYLFVNSCFLSTKWWFFHPKQTIFEQTNKLNSEPNNQWNYDHFLIDNIFRNVSFIDFIHIHRILTMSRVNERCRRKEEVEHILDLIDWKKGEKLIYRVFHNYQANQNCYSS